MKTIVALSAFSLLAGCLDSGLTTGTTESHVETQNRLSSNRLSSNRLSSNRLSSNRLSSNRLSSNGLSAGSTDAEALAAEDGGLELLTYMVSCALPEGESLEVAGTTLPGSIGLAPGWLDRGMTETEQRWLSACLYARVNYFGVTVHLSMRGASDALAADSAEQAAYPLYEGAFWGNLFTDTASEHSCISAYKATDPQVSTMPLRKCTVVDASTGKTFCGYDSAGTCESACSGDTCGGEGQVINVYLEAP